MSAASWPGTDRCSTLLQGAHVLCRAAGDLAPFEQVVRTAGALVPGL
ncbi:hypothetical protein ACFVSN_02975 [Kitasatospora sp. NPDC057904]